MQCNHRFAVLGGDSRMAWLVRALRRSKDPVRAFSVPGCEDTYETMELTLLNSDCIILPIPSFKNDCISGTGIALTQLLDFLHPGMRVFGGRLSDQLSALQQTGATVCDYGTLEQFAAANAVPVALAVWPRRLLNAQYYSHENRGFAKRARKHDANIVKFCGEFSGYPAPFFFCVILADFPVYL